MAIKARFVGKRDADGMPLEYLQNIPAANLSDDEYEALSTQQKHDVRHSGLYQMADAKREAADKPAEKGAD